jgi:hypothetical protein
MKQALPCRSASAANTIFSIVRKNRLMKQNNSSFFINRDPYIVFTARVIGWQNQTSAIDDPRQDQPPEEVLERTRAGHKYPAIPETTFSVWQAVAGATHYNNIGEET